MFHSRMRFLAAAASLLMLISILAGCGSSGGTGGTGSTKKIKVGLVTDIGGLNDRGFNHLADVGLEKAKSDLGVDVAVKESKSGDDYVPNLQGFASQGYDLVIAVGFLMSQSVGTVAASFPNTKFAIIDATPTDAAGNTLDEKNVTSLLFKEQEAGALVGVIAGMLEKQGTSPKKSHNIGAVGGIKIPPVDHYIAGYQWAAKMEDPSVTIQVGYSNDFTDPAKCKNVANAQIAKGADIVFQVAGGCGLGVLQAAGEKGVYSIGVDTDQASSDKSVIASAMKRVDTATYDAIKSVVDNKFQSGTTLFSLSNGGVDYAPGNLSLPSDIQAELKKVEDGIKAGTMKVPDTVS